MAAEPARSSHLADWLLRTWAQPRPSWAARALQPLSWAYAALAAWQRWRIRPQPAPVPVLVVGNLIAGGAGKTPTVLALLPRLRALGFTPGVISRGYGRQGHSVLEVSLHLRADQTGDEPMLIHLRSGAPVVVGADRLAAARALCLAHPEVDLLVSDDGLQHHRLARQAELWVFDERGAGNGLLLPAGPLRQPLPAAVPAHARVLYTTDRPSTALPGTCGRRALGSLRRLEDWWHGAEGSRPADTSRGGGGAADGWSVLQGRPVLAAAGLARPEPFFRMLETRGLRITRLPLPDHHRFDDLPWVADAGDVVVTEKDAVKLRRHLDAPRRAARVWVAALDFQPDAAFETELRALCAHLKPFAGSAAVAGPTPAPPR